jgi:hypothetical protein
MTPSEGFTDPARSLPLSLRDAFARCHKGADSGAAVREQKAARLQSAEQFKQQMELQQKQFDAAQSIKPIQSAPAAPLATGDPQNYYAGLEAKRQQSRRYGPSRTRNVTPQISAIPMGAAPAMAA